VTVQLLYISEEVDAYYVLMPLHILNYIPGAGTIGTASTAMAVPRKKDVPGILTYRGFFEL